MAIGFMLTLLSDPLSLGTPSMSLASALARRPTPFALSKPSRDTAQYKATEQRGEQIDKEWQLDGKRRRLGRKRIEN